jgi:hypothetical protein
LHTAVSALRAAVESPISACGDFTIAEVTLTMRPKRRCAHAADDGADQQDGREQVRLERAEPGGVIPVLEPAGRRTAVVVHEDVGRGAGGQQRLATLFGADVGRDGGHRRAVAARISSAVAASRSASRR